MNDIEQNFVTFIRGDGTTFKLPTEDVASGTFYGIINGQTPEPLIQDSEHNSQEL